MLFVEGNRDWEDVPTWVRFLISVGYRWQQDLSIRRLGLISLPSDSAAAGLVTLGALLRDLENPNANDIAGHYAALARHAQQYLTSCRDCEYRCRPDIKKCGYDLRKTYSGLCLAGRAAGERSTRDSFATVRFRQEGSDFRLDDLLTVNGWSDAAVSRVSFFNVRTEKFDRRNENPALVVADGHVSFLKATGRSEFQQGDILGMFSRTLERDALETLGNKIQSWSQWYETDHELLSRIAPIPRGIAVTVLRRKSLQ